MIKIQKYKKLFLVLVILKIKNVGDGNYRVKYLHITKLKNYLSMKSHGLKFLTKMFFIYPILTIQTHQ